MIPPSNEYDLMLRDLMLNKKTEEMHIEGNSDLHTWIVNTAHHSRSFHDTANMVADAIKQKQITIDYIPSYLRRMTFFPDPLFTAEIYVPAFDNAVIDLSSDNQDDSDLLNETKDQDPSGHSERG